jgi:hypothetical protein
VVQKLDHLLPVERHDAREHVPGRGLGVLAVEEGEQIRCEK